MENSWGCGVFLGSPPLWQEAGRWPLPDTPKAEGAWPQVGTQGRVQSSALAREGQELPREAGGLSRHPCCPGVALSGFCSARLLCRGATQQRKILGEEWKSAQGRQSVVT